MNGLWIAAILLSGAAASAQTKTVMESVTTDYHSVRDMVIRSAEKMPADAYDFKPAPTVRTFAQIIAHVADDQYNLCGPVRAETKQRRYSEIEQTVSGKTELLAALKQAFAYCDAAYTSVTDANMGNVVNFFKSDRTKFAMLNWNLWHTWEHYGNLATYLRIKGLVPPSSEPSPK